MDSRDYGDVAVGARGAHPEVSGLRVAGLRNTLGVAAAHHVGIVIPNRGDAVLLVHVSLSKFDTLISASGGDRAATATTSALINTITLCRDTIIGCHRCPTRRSA